MSESVFSFATFELHPAQRQLLEGAVPVRLGSRAFDLLVALVRRAGDVVTKDELSALVWPGLTVEETNLRVHVAALRKALGDGSDGRRFIANIPSRGYSFVAEVAEKRAEPSAPAEEPRQPAPRANPAGNLPMPLTRIHGRAEVIRALAEQVPRHRLVTIAGSGGIGKSTVALATAERLAGSFADGAAFVDFSSVVEPRLVPSAVASAIGAAPRGDDVVSSLSGFLQGRSMLLLLDSCEHVVDAVAGLAEDLLKAAPRLAILATSREPLRAEGEWVHRLAPLGFPPALPELSASDAMRFAAVQLFVERASANLGGFELTDADAPIVAEICQRLDGIALALELAAGRVDSFGLRQLAKLLDDRFQVLARGRRTARPRHQTLRATLDWSFGLLPEAERVILRRLSIFSGGFTLGAARDVAGGGTGGAVGFGDALASLVDKSLLTTEFSGMEPDYRLFETTRAYAREKLEEAGEGPATARRHAEYHRRLFERAEADWKTRPTGEWLADYGRRADDLRAALHWAFSDDGDREVGVALTVAAVPLWFQLSLVDECLGWVQRALAALDGAAPEPAGQRRRMQLHAASGWLQMYAADRLESGAAAWQAALRFADEIADADYQQRALWALWAYRMNHAEFRDALRLAERFRDLHPAPDQASTAERLVGERMMGTALHFLGDQAGARTHIERMLQRYAPPGARSDVVRFQFDQRITARIALARILWVQGHQARAMEEVHGNIQHALELDHTMSLCNALAQAACPVALLTGDLDAAGRYTAMLRSRASAQALDIWRAYADGYDGEILIRRGEVAAGLALLGRAVDALKQANFVQYLTAFLAALARGLVAAGRHEEGLAAVDEALAHCERSGERWALAELMRIRAQALTLTAGGGASGAAEDLLLQALEIAREQGAASWEIRAAASLAELWRRQHRIAQAHDLLAPIHARFADGSAVPDGAQAATVLAALRAGQDATEDA
jgi:predicted ATPase/DNA-binding winged helix-turn-helix (wHTH) protein